MTGRDGWWRSGSCGRRRPVARHAAACLTVLTVSAVTCLLPAQAAGSGIQPSDIAVPVPVMPAPAPGSVGAGTESRKGRGRDPAEISRRDPATLLLVVVLAVAAVTDIRTGKVYNALTYPAIILGIGLAATGPRGWEAALAGTGVGAVVLLIAWWSRGLGLGDAKLLMAVGALSHADFTIQTAVYGAVVAACLALAMIIAEGGFLATVKRMGAALGLTRHVPAGAPRLLPGGFCICLGGVWALLESWNRTTLFDWVVSLTGR